MAKRDFADHVLPTDPVDLSNQLEIGERALMWVAALQAFAMEQIKAQVRIPGWELVPTRPTRRWAGDDTVMVPLLEELGLSHDMIWETRLRSPAQIEKQLSSNPAARQHWRDHIAETLVESRSSGVKLARTGTPDPREDFANVDGE